MTLMMKKHAHFKNSQVTIYNGETVEEWAQQMKSIIDFSINEKTLFINPKDALTKYEVLTN